MQDSHATKQTAKHTMQRDEERALAYSDDSEPDSEAAPLSPDKLGDM